MPPRGGGIIRRSGATKDLDIWRQLLDIPRFGAATSTPRFDYRISCTGTAQRRTGTGWKTLRPLLNRGRYYVSVNGHRRPLARLVASAWLGKPPHPNAVVAHLDGDLLNCDWTNLIWSVRRRTYGQTD